MVADDVAAMRFFLRHPPAMETTMPEEIEQRRNEFAEASRSNWYAACESGHPFWVGPDRTTYQLAQQDAAAHDNHAHGGSPTAVVLPSGRNAAPDQGLLVLPVFNSELPLTGRTDGEDDEKRCGTGECGCDVISSEQGEKLRDLKGRKGRLILAYGLWQAAGLPHLCVAVRNYGSATGHDSKGKMCFGGNYVAYSYFGGGQLYVQEPYNVCQDGFGYC